MNKSYEQAYILKSPWIHRAAKKIFLDKPSFGKKRKEAYNQMLDDFWWVVNKLGMTFEDTDNKVLHGKGNSKIGYVFYITKGE